MTRLLHFLKGYFVERDPNFGTAFAPALILASLLYQRSPFSNYIFDEQEALLANPYVNGKKLGWLAVFKRDFWGLPPDRTIGSYRPIPNLIWRSLWKISESPWLHHWVNIFVHAANAALLAALVFRLSGRRLQSWLSGGAFLGCAVLTETVTGVVGIADVLGGLGLLLALNAQPLSLRWMPPAVFLSTLLGLFCKESVLVAVPLVSWAALVTAPVLHPDRPHRAVRALGALTATVGALVVYTYFRRHFFPVKLPEDLRASLGEGHPLYRRILLDFLRWFKQPGLPSDPMNNPLAQADFPHRVAGALRVWWRGLCQMVFPWNLSGDYSFPQEPVPSRVVFPESVLGALSMIVLPVSGLGAWIGALVAEHREPPSPVAGHLAVTLSWLALALVWVPLSYFPHSNIPILLPTIRAERFWYLPGIGTSLLVGGAAAALLERTAGARKTAAICVVCAFFSFQAGKARAHALDYTDDLTFWRAALHSAPNSAKAHLNYSVMVGARNRLEERLESNRRALELAPNWPMAHVYYGDTLCRMHRARQAWPHYRRGFELAPDNSSLIALGLQCLYSEHAVNTALEEELLGLARAHPGSWLDYLATDLVHNGKKHGGVEQKYRPRGYNEGPKE